MGGLDQTTPLALVNADKVMGHVVNHPFLNIGEWWVWSAIQTNIVVVAVIMIVLGIFLAKHIGTDADESKGAKRFITNNPFAHMVEVICVYLRDEMVRPLLHERTDKFMPFLWTLFFFILLNNLLGLVPVIDVMGLIFPDMVHHDHKSPIGGTATQSIWVTGALALIAGVVFNFAGVKDLGIKGYLEHQTGGVPLTLPFIPVIILVFFIEIISNIVIKPVALAIRLFANMTAGHILLATILSLAGVGGLEQIGTGIGIGAWFVGTAAGIAIMFLEIFVAFMQAFIFFFLTTVFISLLSHHDEDHDEAHEPEPAMA